MEEDAGKSMHDQDPYDSLIDLNRCGIPLLEIVSEPDMRSGEEAYAYLVSVRRILRYLEICDGNMEEGSMRCDANISVRKRGSEKLGNRVEVKNLNSFRNVQRAIDHEAIRQMEILEKGGRVDRNTVNYNAVTNSTKALRSKEHDNDYRYFPEPDLPPVIVTRSYISSVKESMPALPETLRNKFIEVYGLNDYDAGNLTDEKELALYFEELCAETTNYKAAANWMMGPVKSHLNSLALELSSFPLNPSHIASIIKLIDDNKVSNAAASQKLFPAMIEEPSSDPDVLIKELNILQESDSSVLEDLARAVLADFPDKVEEYKNGKKGLLGLFMGQVMKRSQGKANPKEASAILEQLLEE